MDQTFSRTVHWEGSQGDGLLFRATRVSAISIRPQEADVIVSFLDGPGGEEVWRVEADNAAGSHFECFGSYPLLFKNGIYVKVVDDSGNSNWDMSVAVIEPMSAGT